MKVTIVGAGNIGLAITAYLAAKGQDEVTLFTCKDVLLNGEKVVLEDAESASVVETDDFHVTNDPERAFSTAQMILCTYPAFLRKKFVDAYGTFFSKGMKLGFVPGYGGAEYSCGKLINRGIIIFGLQRVPYVARAEKKENVYHANILSKKNCLYCAAIPKRYSGEIAEELSVLLDIPCTELKEYLAITLAPSNPLLHITGLYNVFHNHDSNFDYNQPLKFYTEWNDDTSRMLFEYDCELQTICKALTPLDMSEVVPLPVYYEAPTPEQMTKKLKSIRAFEAVMVPLKQTGSRYVPDMDSRMFVEDYPFGVCVIKDFARIANVKTPTVDLLLEFYFKLSGHRYFNADGSYTKEILETGIPGVHGLTELNQIVEFYHQ